MRTHDCSGLFFDTSSKKKYLYFRAGLKLKPLYPNTPEGRQKASRLIGNVFIIFSILWTVHVLFFFL